MTSTAAAELLARLATIGGEAAPPVPAVSATDLQAAACLFAVDEPWLQPIDGDAATLPRELASFAGLPAAATCLTRDLHALRAALVREAIAQRPGRTACLVVGDVDYAAAATEITKVGIGEFARGAEVLARLGDGCAVLVVEPWLPEPGAVVALQALLAAARTNGTHVICDEERTAARAATTTVRAEHSLAVDQVVLGPALAAGLPFAAVVGDAGRLQLPDAHPVAKAIAAAALRRAAGHHLQPELARLAAALRDTTTAAAVREQLQIAWRGPATMPRLTFVGQEGADGGLIEHHFALELAALGVPTRGALLFGERLRRGDDGALRTAFDRALARIRIKLVEYNSYLSGGLPYAWPGGHATLRGRGVGVYRYPRMAAVRVAPVPDGAGMRIDFAAGPLGDVTSSGFFVPTMFAGDVEVVARYALQRWRAGPDSACLGLFLQNAPSSARYYAQVMSTADRPHERAVAAGLAGVVHARHAAPRDNGWLRLQRLGQRLIASWRPDVDAPWTTLGECAATADPIFIGAKIWSKVATDGLTADIVELHVVGQPAAAQEPLLGPVPDPRG